MDFVFHLINWHDLTELGVNRRLVAEEHPLVGRPLGDRSEEDLAGGVLPSVPMVLQVVGEGPVEAGVHPVVAGEVVHQLDHFERGDQGTVDLQGEESHLAEVLPSVSLLAEGNRIATQFFIN